MSISLYNHDDKFSQIKNRILQTDTDQKNKELLLDFAEDCLTGWKVPKIGKVRVVTLLQRIRLLTLELNKEWQWYDEKDTKRLLIWMDEKYPLPEKAWSQHGYRIALRKFVTWMRKKEGYPEGYPEREQLMSRLDENRYAEEVRYVQVKEPNKLRDPQAIPTDQEMEWLSSAAQNPRDKAYIEMSMEHGERIGALGTRQIKHVRFDGLGALVTMHDKTFRGEPVRYISSAMYLRQWLDVHPFKDDPEAPLWVNLNVLPECMPLDYDGFRMLIKRLIERHNKLAQKNGKPKIKKNITTHLFRYYAQTRDEKGKMPRTIMCKIRGWKTDSRQPERYARLTTHDVDEYLMQQYGLEENEPETQKLMRCSRCKEVNTPHAMYCYKCGLPLSTDAVEMEEQVRELIDRLLEERMR